jgi:hypothetical protein
MNDGLLNRLETAQDERDYYKARLAHEQATNANLLRALAEANDLNVVRRTAMVNLHEHIEKLDARLAEAERLLRRAANAAKDNVQGDMVVDEIRAFLRPTVSACEHVRINDAWSAENGRCVKCGDTDSAEGGAK